MRPTLRPGDLLVLRRGAQPCAGDLVVADLPGGRGRGVKRAVREEPDGWWVERDNPEAGSDSWVFGAVPSRPSMASWWRGCGPARAACAPAETARGPLRGPGVAGGAGRLVAQRVPAVPAAARLRGCQTRSAPARRSGCRTHGTRRP